jgi:hypothetical protein
MFKNILTLLSLVRVLIDASKGVIDWWQQRKAEKLEDAVEESAKAESDEAIEDTQKRIIDNKPE